MNNYDNSIFCVSENCVNKCGRKLTNEIRATASGKGLCVRVWLFCEEGAVTTNKILSTVAGFPNLGDSNE